MFPYYVKLEWILTDRWGTWGILLNWFYKTSRRLSEMFYIHPSFIFALRAKAVKGICTSHAQHWHNSFTFVYPTFLTKILHGSELRA